MRFLKEFCQIVSVIGTRFVNERFTYSASALTFTTLLAIVPLLAVIVVFLSIFPVFHTLSNQVQSFVFHNFIPASGKIIQEYLQNFIEQASRLSVFGIGFLVVTAIMLMVTIKNSLNDIWKIETRKFSVLAELRYWAVLGLVLIMFAIVILLTSYLVSLPLIQGSTSTLGLQHFLIELLPFALMVLALTLLYVVVPNCRVPLVYGFMAALMASVLFEIAKKAFVFYVTHFPTYRIIYGAFAIIPIFFVWIYFLWVIVLFGALISNVLTNQHFIKKHSGEIQAGRG